MSKTKRPPLTLSALDQALLTTLSRSRTEPKQRVERARVLLEIATGKKIADVMQVLNISRYRVGLTWDKALAYGVNVSLDDLPRAGRTATIPADAKAWLVNLACTKPKDLGYSYELWTNRLLAKHAQIHGPAAGHPSLARLGRGTVSKILARQELKPQKLKYYLERRDPEFEPKMAQILYLYKEVEVWRDLQAIDRPYVAVLSYDEKPGIQTIQNTAPDLPPRPGQHPYTGRDYEYIRHGTLSLLAGIDLFSGQVHGLTRERHRSQEFIDWLKLVDGRYRQDMKIRVILDNHSAHISKETTAFLNTIPDRFEFTFTPKHGSWLNLVETFFGKMARTVLRGIRVASKEELKQRLESYLQEVNAAPVVFKWKAGLDKINIVSS